MPAAASLTNSASTVAFTLPGGTLGFMLWNESAANLRIRMGKQAGASGAKLGIPVPAGSVSAPVYFTHYFDKPLKTAMAVHIYQASGGAISSGVGYELLND